MSWRQTEHDYLTLSVAFDKLPTKSRPRWSSRGGHAYTPASTLEAEQRIRSAWVDANGLAYAEWRGPVSVSIDVWREVPKRASRRGEGSLVCLKPDLDNTAKLVLDALNGVAWADDAQVVHLSISRRRRGPSGTGARIIIELVYLDDREVIS